jgi:hypothetical protein
MTVRDATDEEIKAARWRSNKLSENSQFVQQVKQMDVGAWKVFGHPGGKCGRVGRTACTPVTMLYNQRGDLKFTIKHLSESNEILVGRTA